MRRDLYKDFSFHKYTRNYPECENLLQNIPRDGNRTIRVSAVQTDDIKENDKELEETVHRLDTSVRILNKQMEKYQTTLQDTMKVYEKMLSTITERDANFVVVTEDNDKTEDTDIRSLEKKKSTWSEWFFREKQD